MEDRELVMAAAVQISFQVVHLLRTACVARDSTTVNRRTVEYYVYQLQVYPSPHVSFASRFSGGSSNFDINFTPRSS